MRINKGTEGFFYLPAFYKQSANFGYAVVGITKTCCFNIENYKLAVKTFVALAMNGGNGIVNKIRFAAVNRFNILARFFKSLNGIHNLGESLYNAVVGYRNGFMSPVGGAFNQFARRSKRVHLGHICMQMEFNSFFGGVIL